MDLEEGELKSKLLALVRNADRIRHANLLSMPEKGLAAAKRIDVNIKSTNAATTFDLVSDLGYFIGYMEAVTDLKRTKAFRKEHV